MHCSGSSITSSVLLMECCHRCPRVTSPQADILIFFMENWFIGGSCININCDESYVAVIVQKRACSAVQKRACSAVVYILLPYK